MKFIDIRNSITSKISKKFKVYYENISKVQKPCFLFNLAFYNSKLYSFYIAQKKITIDLVFFPKNEKAPNTEIISTLEEVDELFDVLGARGVKVKDRFVHFSNTEIKTVDEVGHYIIDISLFDDYGKTIDYELMQDLNIRFKEE